VSLEPYVVNGATYFFAWAAFFNPRRSDVNGFASDLDTTLWTAFHGTSRWGKADLFDQYGRYPSWMSGSSYRPQFSAA